MKHVNQDHLGKFALAPDAAKSSVFDENTIKNLNQLNPAYETYTTMKYAKFQSCLMKHQIHDLAKVIIIINNSPGTCYSDCCTIFHLALPDRQDITISLRLLAS